MRLAVCIEQNVTRLDVPMQNAVFVRVMNSPRQLCDEFRRLPDRRRLALEYLIKLSAFDKSHAEVAGALALADLVNGDDARMLEACSGFGFPAKSFYVRFARPMTQCNDLERDGAIKTGLTGTVNYTLAAPADFLQQLIVAKCHLHSCRLVRAIVIVLQRSQASFEKANAAQSSRRICKDGRSTFCANSHYTDHGCFSSQSFWKTGSARNGSQSGSSLRRAGVTGVS